MLYEDFWIKSDGSIKGPLAQSEHAEEALRVLLRLPENFSIPRVQLFTGISPKTEESARSRGVPENVLAYLTRDQIDPRTWMIQKEGWIRVSKNKMNVWMFNDQALDLIRTSDYWKHQTKASPFDMVEIDELSGNDKFEVPVRALRNINASADAIKEIALRRGEFSFPEAEAAEEEPVHLPRVGGYTDKPGDERWLYQSVGGNPPSERGLRVPMDLSPITVRDPASGESMRFQPQGKIEVHVDEEGAAEAGMPLDQLVANSRRIVANPPLEIEDTPSQGARLMIGFNVGIKKTWTLDGVLNLAFWIRRRQVAAAFEAGAARPSSSGGDLGMTFLVQKGVWQPVGDKHAYPEDGTSLIIINTINEAPGRFKQDVEDLAEELATRLKQQAILVEHQENGIATRRITMGPR